MMKVSAIGTTLLTALTLVGTSYAGSPAGAQDEATVRADGATRMGPDEWSNTLAPRNMPQPTGGFLVDYGSPGGGSGYAVSGANQAFGGFTQFQPFTVTDAAGWSVTTIGADGFWLSNPSGTAAAGTLVGDSAGQPDEGNVLADTPGLFLDRLRIRRGLGRCPGQYVPARRHLLAAAERA